MIKRRIIFGLGVALILYIAAYALLSAMGKYEPSQTGQVRWGFGLSVTDVEVWRPKFVHLRVWRGIDGKMQAQANLLGWLFLPLEIADRRWCHPSLPYIPERQNTENGRTQ
jgi:hypothetical protein